MISTRSTFVTVILALTIAIACSGEPEKVYRALDRETMQAVTITGDLTRPVNIYEADFAIVGGGLGGIAASLAICSSGRTVILIEESDRIAGCFSVGDTTRYSENRFVETSGSSRTYQTFRKLIREWYDERDEEAPMLFSSIYADLADFTPDAFCFNTEAALDVIDTMLSRNVERGRLTVLKRHKVGGAIMYNDRVHSLQAIDLDKNELNQIAAWMYIDASETGYLFPRTGIEYRVGREGRDQTGEPHAAAAADTMFARDFVYCPDVDLDDDVSECVVSPVKGTPPGGDGGAVRFGIVSAPRRIEALLMINETDISAESNTGPRARFFEDSVGIGYHPITLDDGNPESPATVVTTKPFQVPLRALVHTRIPNLLSGGRTLGATYVASTAFQGPAVEWCIGEAAGQTAAFCAGNMMTTHDLVNTPDKVDWLQDFLVDKQGVPIYWYSDVTPDDDDFVEAQLKPFKDPSYHEQQTTLRYHSGGGE